MIIWHVKFMMILILRHEYMNSGWCVHIMRHRLTLTQYKGEVDPLEEGGYREIDIASHSPFVRLPPV